MEFHKSTYVPLPIFQAIPFEQIFQPIRMLRQIKEQIFALMRLQYLPSRILAHSLEVFVNKHHARLAW